MYDKHILGIITAADIVNRFGFHIQEESKYGVIDDYIQKVELSDTDEEIESKS